jgi:hypothetical protein
VAYYPHVFTGPLVVHRVGRYRYRVVFLPPELAAQLPFDRHPRLRMEGEIAEHPVHAAWQPLGERGSGGHYVMVSPAVCRAAGLRPGEPVEVRFRVADPDAVQVPEELEQALAADDRARAAWDALTAGRRRGLSYLVASARTSDTRHRRAATLVADLVGGRVGPRYTTAGSSRTTGSGAPDQVKRKVAPRRTPATSAGRKQATQVPPARRTLG